MTRRELIKNLIAGKPAPRCGFWMGKPMPETIEKYTAELGLPDLESLGRYLGDDVRWITPQYVASTYRHPGGMKLRHWKDANPYAMEGGLLSAATTVEEVENFAWPDTKYLDFTETIRLLDNVGDYYRLSGFWAPFFHDLTYLFGTESLLIKMYTDPELIHAALNRLCAFYYEANELFYAQAGDRIDGMFFGNDFGMQTSLLFSPELFEEFFFPQVQRFSQQAHKYGYQSVLHCCGAIHSIIGRLIDAGVDCLHPIQALAADMDAGTLARDFKGKIRFMGGIDTQQILPHGSADEVKAETKRVMDLLSPGIIISPSHEALMPNVPFANVKAMADAVHSGSKTITVIGSYIVALVMESDRLPNQGETLLARNYHSAHGGKGSNQAVQAARLGADVRFVSKIGNDSAGEAFKQLCLSEKVGSTYIFTDALLPTATGFIICSASGHNIITIDIAALNALTKAEIDHALESVHAGEIVLLQLEIPFEIAYYAAVKAKERGAVVILNPAPACDLRKYDLSVIDYLTPNETEARICAGLPTNSPEDESEIAGMLVKMGCPNIIVTLGEKGSLHCNADGCTHYEPFPLDKTVDSTGAGDAFNAALAVALHENMPFEEAIRFANAAGALSCTRHDTIPSFGTREEVMEFIRSFEKV
jgi:ribokinase